MIVRLLKKTLESIGLVVYKAKSIEDYFFFKKSSLAKLNELYLNYLNSKIGDLTTAEFLQKSELDFGGYVYRVKSNIKSKNVVRKDSEFHVGGDRMSIFFHDYSEKYAQYLEFFKLENINLLEIGILNGGGLAIWDRFFDNKKIYGFDYDLSNFLDNFETLKGLGAFKKQTPIVVEFDQFASNNALINSYFKKNLLDVVIDDGNHSDEACVKSFNDLYPYLNNKFVYFIEDNKSAYRHLMNLYEDLNFDIDLNGLTVISRNLN